MLLECGLLAYTSSKSTSMESTLFLDHGEQVSSGSSSVLLGTLMASALLVVLADFFVYFFIGR